MSRGRFIVLEGGEGAGKSTQAKLLTAALERAGKRAYVTREPGGAPLAESIRALWLADHAEKWDALTEVLLLFAARREHLTKTVWPMLRAETWVVCDRFIDSTLVYQGEAMGQEAARIMALYAMVAGDFVPDLTLLLDLPVATARQRIAARQLDRYERLDDSFHETLRQGFLRLAQADPARHRVIDAAAMPEQVAAALWQQVAPLLDGAS